MRDGDLVLEGVVDPPAKDYSSMSIRLALDKNVEKENIQNSSDYHPIGELFFRPNKSIIAKKLKNLPPGNLEIVINKKMILNYLTLADNLKTAKVNSLGLLNAIHSVSGDVKNLLLSIDQNYAEIIPGEIIDFEFEKGNTPAEKREYILKSVGRYETDTTLVFNSNSFQ